jgi:membrane dipeptidase
MIAAMNRAGMLVDLSHGGKRTQLTAAQASEASPYLSHNNAFTVCENRRNATDETMRVVAGKGGMMSVMPLELRGNGPDATVARPMVRDMGDHVVYALEVMGEDGVGVASDFPKSRKAVYETAYIDSDGYFNIQYDGTLSVKRTRWGGPGTLMAYPWWDYAAGFRNYPDYPNITRELVAREIDPEVIEKVLGLNFLELYAKVVG